MYSHAGCRARSRRCPSPPAGKTPLGTPVLWPRFGCALRFNSAPSLPRQQWEAWFLPMCGGCRLQLSPPPLPPGGNPAFCLCAGGPVSLHMLPLVSDVTCRQRMIAQRHFTVRVEPDGL
eukprot:scaffold17478_cov142-Isochrysis_galbana.AAC.3